eukprot:jgi/Tetstr1/430470/TSEL_020278.t1
MQDATPAQLTFLEGELARFVESDPWEFGACRKWVSRPFLVPKPGVNQWRRIIDLHPTRSKRYLRRTKWRGARNLLYVDDFLLFSASMKRALHLRQRLANLLNALGLQRNPTKDFWKSRHFGRHLRVDIDSASGMSYAPAGKLDRLSRQATRLIGRATRNAKWLPRWGGVLNGRLEAQGLWSSADERQHSVTWKELKAKLQHSGAAATVVASRCWEGKTWHQALTDLAVEEVTVAPRAGLFRRGRQDWRDPGTMARYATWLGNLGTIKASSLQPYMSAVNNFFKDHGREPMAPNDLVFAGGRVPAARWAINHRETQAQ